MGAFPNFNIPPAGGTSGGVPQYFTSKDPHSFFPGSPQFNLGMSQMMSDYGSLDPELESLMGGYDQYGNQLRKQAAAKGVFESTNAQDALASQYGPNAKADALAAEGLAPGSEGNAGYASAMLGTAPIKAAAQRAKADVAGQIALQKQALQNQYRQNQMQRVGQMVQLASQAAGSQYGYQGAQLSADRGQISLDNAQNAEQQANMSGLMGMLFGQNAPSLFGSGPNSAFGPLSGGGGFLSSFLGSGGGGFGADLGLGSLEGAGAGSGAGVGSMLMTMGMM